jgi:FAD/FMN-containing dehydrogenase
MIHVDRKDARYKTIRKSRNLRWPAAESEYAGQIVLCESVDEVAEALQSIVNAGIRPTVRSGGHCYEDFVVNNPNGAIIDLGLLKTPHLPNETHPHKISAGMQLGEAYLDLYKRYGVTIPAGSCYTVGAGGHISGGGYGVLSRLFGLTVDWLSEVDILTVDIDGKVIHRKVDQSHDADLFRACRGAGGGMLGIITSFQFEKLPPAPVEVVSTGFGFDWKDINESKFISIVQTYGNYWETRGKEPDTWGLFTLMGLSHSVTGRFGISLQFCNPDGTCRDLSVVKEFLDRFQPYSPRTGAPDWHGDRRTPRSNPLSQEYISGIPVTRHEWLSATVHPEGSGEGRAKYKSCYMKRNFTEEEARRLYQHLTKPAEDDFDPWGFVLSVDSYGGAINKPELAKETSIWQRSSIMKLQYQYYWLNPKEDESRLKWLDELYSDVYSTTNVDARYAATPYPGKYYEGCYMNYPDADMLRYPFWPQLYYGEGELYPFLQSVKRKYDPKNIFHHSMSIRT